MISLSTTLRRGFKTLNETCEIIGIQYQRQQPWDRPDLSQISLATLSPQIDTVIERLRSSEYHKIDNSEAWVRVIVELLILDRLEHLSDDGSLQHLQLFPEVDLKLLCGNHLVTDRADWLLCHEDPRDSIESTLIAIEAKVHPCGTFKKVAALAFELDCVVDVEIIGVVFSQTGLQDKEVAGIEGQSYTDFMLLD